MYHWQSVPFIDLSNVLNLNHSVVQVLDEFVPGGSELWLYNEVSRFSTQCIPLNLPGLSTCHAALLHVTL